NVRRVEEYLRRRLKEVGEVLAVHGLGFLLGIEFKENAAAVHKRFLEHKIITGTSSNPKVLRLLPPLCLEEAHIDMFVLAADEHG
ncbi:MAG TPA: aminotransferase class III-fold pyridoxal phosphate-dependent enzyme, partial [Pyrinomonadaceae bacterium]|nr:aminotransferase class III-fold pyridoxal phosphate-dependent enzyme [Pyrinomonadaceae bacterium]